MRSLVTHPVQQYTPIPEEFDYAHRIQHIHIMNKMADTATASARRENSSIYVLALQLASLKCNFHVNFKSFE